MPTKAIAAAAAGLLTAALAGAPADAHHSIQAVVDTGKVLQGQMVLTKIDWINPHAWFHFTLTKADGSVVKDVPVEWMGINGLRQQGYASADVFQVGHTFNVRYNPNRDGSEGGHLVSMTDQATGANYGGPPGPPPPPAPRQRPDAVPTTKINF